MTLIAAVGRTCTTESDESTLATGGCIFAYQRHYSAQNRARKVDRAPRRCRWELDDPRLVQCKRNEAAVHVVQWHCCCINAHRFRLIDRTTARQVSLCKRRSNHQQTAQHAAPGRCRYSEPTALAILLNFYLRQGRYRESARHVQATAAVLAGGAGRHVDGACLDRATVWGAPGGGASRRAAIEYMYGLVVVRSTPRRRGA